MNDPIKELLEYLKSCHINGEKHHAWAEAVEQLQRDCNVFEKDLNTLSAKVIAYERILDKGNPQETRLLRLEAECRELRDLWSQNEGDIIKLKVRFDEFNIGQGPDSEDKITYEGGNRG